MGVATMTFSISHPILVTPVLCLAIAFVSDKHYKSYCTYQVVVIAMTIVMETLLVTPN
jgi:hypothetical protein